MNPALDYAEIETAWAAGLFEGEGCFSREKRWNKFVIYISMTDRDVIDRFARWAGYGNVVEHLTPTMKRKGNQVQYLWRCQGTVAEKIADRMIPHLGKRRTERYEEIMQIVHGGAKE